MLLLLLCAFGVLSVAAAPVRAQPALLVAQGDEEPAPDATEVSGDEPGEGQETEGTGATEEEEGPPWTYQMARLSLVLIVLLGLGIYAAYHRFVVRRSRGLV